MARMRFSYEAEEPDWQGERRRRRQRARSDGLSIGFDWFWRLDPWTMLAFFFLFIGLAIAIFAVFIPELVKVTFIVAGLMLFMGNLLILLGAFSEEFVLGLACLFVPFFGLYYFVSRIDDLKPAVLWFGAGVLTLIGAVSAQALNVSIRGPNPAEIPEHSPATPEPEPPPRKTPRLEQSAPPDQANIDLKAPKVTEQTVFLSDLSMFDVTNGPWPVTIGNSGAPDRYPVRVGGQTSMHGIGMHPPNAPGSARASFTLPKNSKRFKGWAALNEHNRDVFTPVSFVVYGDDRLLWESQDITRRGGPVDFDIDVSTVKVLTLETRTRNHFNAHAVWFEPRIEQ